jgi:hypothetical protein
VHGPIDDDLYPYYHELGDEVGLLAISDRQHELAPDLNSIGRVHNARRIDEWSFPAGKGDYAPFPWPVRRRRQVRFDRVLLNGPGWHGLTKSRSIWAGPYSAWAPRFSSGDSLSSTPSFTRWRAEHDALEGVGELTPTPENIRPRIESIKSFSLELNRDVAAVVKAGQKAPSSLQTWLNEVDPEGHLAGGTGATNTDPRPLC